MVGVCAFALWVSGAKVNIGWETFLFLAHRINFGISTIEKTNPNKNANPALTEMYWKRFMSKKEYK
jgi:hypothetical protein